MQGWSVYPNAASMSLLDVHPPHRANTCWTCMQQLTKDTPALSGLQRAEARHQEVSCCPHEFLIKRSENKAEFTGLLPDPRMLGKRMSKQAIKFRIGSIMILKCWSPSIQGGKSRCVCVCKAEQPLAVRNKMRHRCRLLSSQ